MKTPERAAPECGPHYSRALHTTGAGAAGVGLRVMAAFAFIGLGKMGLGMAGRLLDAGLRLSVYNRTASKAAPLQERGARACACPREACDGADAVFVMTADDSSSRAVWLGSEGILAARMSADALAIECSTLSHDWVLELAGEARRRSLRFLDAPVTGLPADAARGALTLLVGADARDLESAAELFAPISQRVIHFGAVGTGTAYKLMINMIGAVQIASIAEGLALAERAGLNFAAVLEALSSGQAASPQVVRTARRIIAGDHDSNVVFTPQLRLKDIDYALRLARELGVGAPFGALAASSFRSLCELGFTRVNESRIIEVARARAPE